MLFKFYRPHGIPMLMICSKSGKIITKYGVDDINTKGE